MNINDVDKHWHVEGEIPKKAPWQLCESLGVEITLAKAKW